MLGKASDRPVRYQAVKITDPIDGAILNRHDGKQDSYGLEIVVRGGAPEGSKVTVNDFEAKTVRGSSDRYDEFICVVNLRNRENIISVTAEKKGVISKDNITVLWDKNSYKRYRFSTDDNILFLKDLAFNASRYTSIFDNDYLAFWRRMHEEYGARIHFNIYYQTEGFNLSQMPEKYKGEWEENANWMRLTWHGLQDEPPNPYINANYREVEHDFKLVTREIERFAGDSLLSPFTTIHWGEATLEGCRALRDNGIKGLVGVFNIDLNTGKPQIAYYLDEQKTRYLAERDYWKDVNEGIYFIKHDLVINNVKLADIASSLDSIASNPHRSDLMEVIIHEQYFHPELKHYLPDAKERVIATLDWLKKNGYESIFYEEGFLGSPE